MGPESRRGTCLLRQALVGLGFVVDMSVFFAENWVQMIGYWALRRACKEGSKTKEKSQNQLRYRNRNQADWQCCAVRSPYAFGPGQYH